MIFTTSDLDKRKALTKALLDSCAVIDFPALKDSDVKAWARMRLKELKTSAADEVLSEVIRLVGTDIQTLVNELDKLASAAAETSVISMSMVDELIGRSRELSNFELGDHLLARNRKRALETLCRLLDDGAEPVMLIGLLAGNYHRLALGKYLLSKGSAQDVFKNIPLPPFKRDPYINALRRIERLGFPKAFNSSPRQILRLRLRKHSRLQLEVLICELAS